MDGGQDVPRRLLFFYALPGVALAIPTIPVYVFLPTFYAETVGLGLAATGGIMLAARIVDVVSDPMVGWLSDRMVTRWGRRKPWIVAGAIVAGAALVALFHPPSGASGLYLLLGAVALYLGWTCVAIPFFAWGAELSRDYHQRSRITGAREGAMLVGVLFAGALPALAAYAGFAEAAALSIIAWVAILSGAPAVTLLIRNVPEPVGYRASPPLSSWGDWRLVLSNRPFLRLLAAWFVNGLANGLPAVLFPLYLAHGLLASQAERGALIFLYFASAVAAIPVWLAASRRIGKHRVWCLAMLAACAGFVWVPLLAPGQIAWFAGICVVTGAALGADLALPPSMQADVVDFDTLRSGQQRAGLFFALWSMATKLALAGAVGIGFPALAYFGFDAGGTNDEVARNALVVIYALVPVVLKISAVAMVWRHPITARRQTVIRRRLAQRLSRAARQAE